MITELFAVQRLLWWLVGVLSFVYFAYRSINPRLGDLWNSGDKGRHHLHEVLIYLTEYKEPDLYFRRMFGSRIVWSVLAVIVSGFAFTVYLRPEFAGMAEPGQVFSAGFLLPLLAICLVLLGALLVSGVFSAWDLGSSVIYFSGQYIRGPEYGIRRMEKFSWIYPAVLAVITGLLVMVAALIF